MGLSEHTARGILIDQLPAIYSQDGISNASPLNGIIGIWTFFFESLEEYLEQLPWLWDPSAAPSEKGGERGEFLTWLASWLALEIDEEWLLGEGKQDVKDISAGRRGEKLRYLLTQVAGLYPLRGTRKGLKDMIKAFYDIDIQVIEWAWPSGLTIGVDSLIGVNTFLSDMDNTENGFVVVLQLEPLEQGLPYEDVDWVEMPLAGEQAGRTCLMGIAGEGHSQGRLVGRLQKLQRLVNLESPAHASCYLGFRVTAAEQKPMVEPFVIDIRSTIDTFFIV